MDREERKLIETEWSKYKYCVMEKSYKYYKEISQKISLGKYSYEEFISDIDNFLGKQSNKSQIINTLYHIWGYFKRDANEEDRSKFFESLDNFKNGQCSLKEVKEILYQYAVKYESTYLLNSYYFNTKDEGRR